MPRYLSASILFTLVASCAVLSVTPASAADGEVLITHNKALAGGVTPTDAAGYPVTLSSAGSYKLASNLTPGPNLDGIVAASADITIDLNGFRISGGPAGGTNNARFGIWGKGDRLTVKNGTIGAFKSAGIYAPNRPYLIVENMRIINGRGYGINNSGGDIARIQNNTVATNLTNGILCGDSCHIEGNVVSSNGGYGIRVTRGTVLGNTVFSNQSYGVTSVFTMGLGNNTIIDNNNGNDQTDGGRIHLFPNACSPGTC